MKSKIKGINLKNLMRLTLSILIFNLQLVIPYSDILAASHSEKAGTLSTAENQAQQESGIKPYVAGDAIQISTFPDTLSFLNGVFPIDDQGYIEFPVGDRINVASMNEDNLIKYLKDNYQNYLFSPNLFVKPMIRVGVVGGFVKPGFYYVEKKISLWDLIQLAGGLNSEKALNNINWERNGETVVDDITPYLENGVSLNSMGFKSGDLVWAPSPDSEDSWTFVVSKVLPVAAFATTIYLMWMTYQTNTLIAQRR